MDTSSRGELLAANMTIDEIRNYLNVDSLAYLTLDRLIKATGAVGAGFCTACLTGEYPEPVTDAESEDPSETPVAEPQSPATAFELLLGEAAKLPLPSSDHEGSEHAGSEHAGSDVTGSDVGAQQSAGDH